MSEVNNWVTCPQCKQPESCYTEYKPRTGEEWAFCNICGYWRGIIALRDKKKNTKIRKLVKEGKINEALSLTGCRSTEDLKYSEFFKLTKDNHLIYRQYQKKGYGAYLIEPKGGGIGPFGHLHHEKEIRQKQIQQLLSMRDKYNVKVTEVLDDGAIKEY